MTKPVSHPGADDDFLESYLYYAKTSRPAAAAYDRIAADPKGGTAYDETYRF